MMNETSCDGVMVGRAAMGNPWLLGRVAMFLETGALLPEPTPIERIAVAREHARLQVAQQGEHIGCRELRGLLGHYFKGLPGAPRIREALTKVTTLGGIERVLDNALTTCEAAASPRPVESELATAPQSLVAA
jgi:tRNA-dihydrouridine synthase